MSRKPPLLQLLSPSITGMFAYTFISFAILVAANFHSLGPKAVISPETSGLSNLFHGNITSFLNWLNSLSFAPHAVLFMLYASLGALLYVIAWLIISAFLTAENNLVVGATYTTFGTNNHRNY